MHAHRQIANLRLERPVRRAALHPTDQLLDVLEQLLLLEQVEVLPAVIQPGPLVPRRPRTIMDLGHDVTGREAQLLVDERHPRRDGRGSLGGFAGGASPAPSVREPPLDDVQGVPFRVEREALAEVEGGCRGMELVVVGVASSDGGVAWRFVVRGHLPEVDGDDALLVLGDLGEAEETHAFLKSWSAVYNTSASIAIDEESAVKIMRLKSRGNIQTPDSIALFDRRCVRAEQELFHTPLHTLLAYSLPR